MENRAMDRAYIDYLRVTTWDSQQYLYLISKIRNIDKNWRPGRFLQYQGQKSEHMFYGVGIQRDTRHHLIHASGAIAQMFYEHCNVYENLHCSRIDLQKTIVKPSDYDPLKLYEEIKHGPGNKRHTSLILSDTGSTVYMGNRSSDTFIRIYEKEIDDKQFLRLEIEVKGITALDVWQNLVQSVMRETEIFDILTKRFKAPSYLWTWFDTEKDSNGKMNIYQEYRYKNNKMQWLGSLGPTIIKLGKDHDHGEVVKNWLLNWLEAIDD